MGHMHYEIPIEEALTLKDQGILRTLSYWPDEINIHGIVGTMGQAYVLEAKDGPTIISFGTKVSVSLVDLDEEYFNLKERYDSIKAFKERHR